MDDRRNTILSRQKIILFVNALLGLLIWFKGSDIYYSQFIWVLIMFIGIIDIVNIASLYGYKEYDEPYTEPPVPVPDPEPPVPVPEPKPTTPPAPKPQPPKRDKQVVVIYRRTRNDFTVQCKHCDYLNKSYSTKCDLCGSVLE